MLERCRRDVEKGHKQVRWAYVHCVFSPAVANKIGWKMLCIPDQGNRSALWLYKVGWDSQCYDWCWLYASQKVEAYGQLSGYWDGYWSDLHAHHAHGKLCCDSWHCWRSAISQTHEEETQVRQWRETVSSVSLHSIPRMRKEDICVRGSRKQNCHDSSKRGQNERARAKDSNSKAVGIP